NSWQSGRMGWMLVDDRPEGMDPIPETLHWNEWLGVAPVKPYVAKFPRSGDQPAEGDARSYLYHPFNWRAWQDFSNGQLGDFGCHILDPVFMAIGLTAPTTIRAESSPLNREVWYKWSVVHYEFPGTERTAGKTLKVTWYDGNGKLPPRDRLGVGESVKLPQSGSLFVGEKGSMLLPHVGAARLLPEERFRVFHLEKV